MEKEKTVSTTRDVFRVFAHHLKRYWLIAVAIVVGMVFSNALDVVAPLYYKKLVDLLALPGDRSTAAIVLFGILVTIALLRGASWVFFRISDGLNTHLQTRVMRDLTDSSFVYLIRHSFQFFTNAFSGSLVRKVNRLSRAFEMVADDVSYKLVPLAITLAGVLYVLWSHNQTITIVMMVWIVVFVSFNVGFASWALKFDIERAAKDSHVTGVLADAIGNSANIKLFSGYRHENSLFAKVNDDLRRLRVRSWGVHSINFAVQALLMIGMEIGVMYLAISAWRTGAATVGDFILLQSYVINIFGKLWDVSRVVRRVHEGIADAKEMVDILNLPHEIRDAPTAEPLWAANGAITFRKVSFYYQSTRPVLRDFSVEIKPKEKVALVGPSGAGKSTVVKLLFRFYDVDRGDIIIDGQKISRVTQDSLRDAIAMVPQEPNLFHRSLMENIRYGRRDATDAEVYAAAQKAHCHEFITDFPDGYETLVGERGVKLSGGERQRVAIARAILKNAPILVLDEATSSLDSESESFIQEALKELMREKTVIVIAHRLSTIMQMDRIVVMESGRVTDTGTHAELLTKRGGTYKKLWEIQAGGFLP